MIEGRCWQPNGRAECGRKTESAYTQVREARLGFLPSTTPPGGKEGQQARHTSSITSAVLLKVQRIEASPRKDSRLLLRARLALRSCSTAFPSRAALPEPSKSSSTVLISIVSQSKSRSDEQPPEKRIKKEVSGRVSCLRAATSEPIPRSASSLLYHQQRHDQKLTSIDGTVNQSFH